MSQSSHLRFAAALLGAVTMPLSALAQTAPPSPVRNDGFVETVVVTGQRLRAMSQPGSTSILSAEELAARDVFRASEALVLLPGVHFQPGNRGGARNEASVYLRGFDLSRVPVLLDGIPIYVPYDGYIDLNRLQTFDLAGVEVARGYASVLYGPNAMGGAINLVTRRPEAGFAARAVLRFDAGRGLDASGTRLTALASYGGEDWYAQAGVGWLDRRFTELAKDFRSGLFQPPGRRLRSKSEDMTFNFKTAWTPGEDEYALTLVVQNGEKGAPPYAGLIAANATFFDWPYYDKRSVYLTTRTALGEGYSLRGRFYYDAFRNQLKRFDNSTYTTQLLPFAFTSDYDDDTVGGSLELSAPWIRGGETRLAAFLKRDTHREFRPSGPVSVMRDLTGSIAASVRIPVGERVTVAAGTSYDWRDAEVAQDPAFNGTVSFPLFRREAVNWQFGVEYALTPDVELFAGLSRKTRFPTMFERYSYRLGNGQPNPALEPETLLTVEGGVRGEFTSWLSGSASVFWGEAEGFIQSVTIGRNARPPFNEIVQFQNIGEVRIAGFETDLDVEAGWFSGRLAYTWLDRDLTNRPGLFLFGTPRHKLDVDAEARLGGGFFVGASLTYQSSLFTSDRGTGNPIGVYALAGLKAGWRSDDGYGVTIGARNLFDRLYEFDAGYPGEGRSFFVTLSADL
jgi:iron complex outermembrane receptor protein